MSFLHHFFFSWRLLSGGRGASGRQSQSSTISTMSSCLMSPRQFLVLIVLSRKPAVASLPVRASLPNGDTLVYDCPACLSSCLYRQDSQPASPPPLTDMRDTSGPYSITSALSSPSQYSSVDGATFGKAAGAIAFAGAYALKGLCP